MQQPEGNVLLTDLCAICHTNPIKYTCPRCGIHTCSLPCVKRHKSWAQCSGIRDPAAYRKRNDLATSSSVDQDFNFITSVERSLQRADEQTLSRGVDLIPSGLRTNRKSRFEDALAERRIRLIKAPKGLSRNKENKSHWGGDKGLVWTTELIHWDGRKKLANVFEGSNVQDAFDHAFRRRRPSSTKKRKRSHPETHAAPRGNTSPTPQTELGADHDREELVQGSSEPRIEAPDQLSSRTDTAMIIKSSDDGESYPQRAGTRLPEENTHFYLFRPNTTSKVKCVIPVAADAKLIDVLRDRTLLEFPTFYIRPEAPESLPEPFVTEGEYDSSYGTDVAVNMPIFASEVEVEEGEIVDLATIDEKKVLEVLQKDLIG